MLKIRKIRLLKTVLNLEHLNLFRISELVLRISDIQQGFT
jgi:hypothetical protein